MGVKEHCVYVFYLCFFIYSRKKQISGNSFKKNKIKIRLSVETKKNKKERLSVVAALDSVRFLQVALRRCMT